MNSKDLINLFHELDGELSLDELDSVSGGASDTSIEELLIRATILEAKNANKTKEDYLAEMKKSFEKNISLTPDDYKFFERYTNEVWDFVTVDNVVHY